MGVPDNQKCLIVIDSDINCFIKNLKFHNYVPSKKKKTKISSMK